MYMFFNAMESISNICKKVVSLAHKFKQGRMPSDESFLLLIILCEIWYIFRKLLLAVIILKFSLFYIVILFVPSLLITNTKKSKHKRFEKTENQQKKIWPVVKNHGITHKFEVFNWYQHKWENKKKKKIVVHFYPRSWYFDNLIIYNDILII